MRRYDRLLTEDQFIRIWPLLLRRPHGVMVGGVYAPPDSDGIWPHSCVRELIEETESSHLESGLHSPEPAG
jgi:hypothetical protein